MDIYFSSQEDLYHRLVPALRVKVRNFKRMSTSGVREKDIWDYLKSNKWNKVNGLTLSGMVQDILDVTYTEVLEYIAMKQEVI